MGCFCQGSHLRSTQCIVALLCHAFCRIFLKINIKLIYYSHYTIIILSCFFNVFSVEFYHYTPSISLLHPLLEKSHFFNFLALGYICVNNNGIISKLADIQSYRLSPSTTFPLLLQSMTFLLQVWLATILLLGLITIE